jgi:hypothetical protein
LDRGMPEGVGSVLVGQVEEKPSTRAGMTIAVILVDPGDVRELDLLLDRVETREGEPVPLDEGDHFGMVAAGRALEASFEVEEPSAIVILGRNTPEERYGVPVRGFRPSADRGSAARGRRPEILPTGNRDPSPARGPLSAPPKPWRGPSVPMI